MIGAVLLGNTLVDVLAAALATSLGLQLFGPAGVAYATGIVTILIVVFSAVLPKTFAMAAADRVALLVAPFMRLAIVGLAPATTAIQFIVRQLLKLTPTKVDDAANILAAHESRAAPSRLSEKEGTVARGDANMLGVSTCASCRCSTSWCTAPRWRHKRRHPPAKIIDDVLKSQYSRIPIWKDEPDNIVGVLHTKDLLVELARNGWDAAKLDLASLAAQPWFVPDTTSVTDQLNEFLKRKAQLALVVDEYGEVQGLITLEDILEESWADRRRHDATTRDPPGG
jgi:Mg2+/Co2+ transporter CorB